MHRWRGATEHLSPPEVDEDFCENLKCSDYAHRVVETVRVIDMGIPVPEVQLSRAVSSRASRPYPDRTMIEVTCRFAIYLGRRFPLAASLRPE